MSEPDPLNEAVVTVDAVLRRHAEAFRQAGLESPELDASLLLGQAMGMKSGMKMGEPSLSLALHGDRTVALEALATMAAMAARRLEGEPVSRILGQRAFWRHDFALNPHTLVPRPDSETVVEAALDCLKLAPAGASGEAYILLDLGTGSGCLLVSVLQECLDTLGVQAIGIGVDLSPEALVQARRNAANAGLAAHTHWLAASWGEALNLKADIVLSNPPYIPHGDIARLSAEVRLHDPAHALDGGSDGLDAYRALAKTLPRLMKPDAYAILEIGAGQHDSVVALMKQAGLALAFSRRDLGGHVRALVFRHGS